MITNRDMGYREEVSHAHIFPWRVKRQGADFIAMPGPGWNRLGSMETYI